MKIIYGVSGEGFGHSTRADKVIKYLQGKGHEVLVLTYGQSFKPLSKFNIKRIDGVKILYNKKTLLLGRTLIYNLAWFFRNLKNFNILKEEIKRFNPSVIITDMEPLTSRIAKSLKLPLISLDNEHMLTHSNLKIKKNMNYYIAKMSIENCVPNPDKIIAAHYHRIDVGNENVKIVDPVLRDEIVNLRSVKGDFILVYLTKPDEEIVNLLWNINQSFILYGLGEGYGKFRNVVSALEFERLECASGPQEGHIKRFSDGETPKKIAFLQCIGSRSDRVEKYCSSICCMYTTKEAMIAYEHDNELESYVFYIDMRAGGKGFQSFLRRGAAEYNIKYIKSKIAQITVDQKENPIIIYEDLDNGKITQLKVDMVVLATCIVPPQGIKNLAEVLGIELNDYNFIKTTPFIPVETSKNGIFTCGCVHEPMDIPRSVAEASGAAAKAAEIIRGG